MFGVSCRMRFHWRPVAMPCRCWPSGSISFLKAYWCPLQALSGRRFTTQRGLCTVSALFWSAFLASPAHVINEMRLHLANSDATSGFACSRKSQVGHDENQLAGERWMPRLCNTTQPPLGGLMDIHAHCHMFSDHLTYYKLAESKAVARG